MIPSRRQEGRQISIPHFFVNRSGEFNWNKLASVMFSALAFIVIACFALSLTYAAAIRITRKPGPPPKIITKVVYQSALTAAQNAYISQCKQNEPSNSYNHGVPDVHTNTWTCTYAK